MGKDATKPEAKKDQSADQSKNIVDKILKNKNRFRSGLGFRQGKSTKEDEKARISQGVSKKKILQGTRADKTHGNDDDDNLNLPEVNPTEEIELGNKNYFAIEDADENTALSQQAVQRKSKYFDPRTAFLEKIKEETNAKS